MPPTFSTEGLDAAKQIRDLHPTVGVLVLSQFVETHHALQLLASGAGGIGYLLKDRVGNLEELSDALERVAAGASVIDPEVVTGLVARRRTRDRVETLTDREREVLGLMAEGRSNQAIATGLSMSDRTVE